MPTKRTFAELHQDSSSPPFSLVAVHPFKEVSTGSKVPLEAGRSGDLDLRLHSIQQPGQSLGFLICKIGTLAALRVQSHCAEKITQSI